jgi:predicted DNA-binding WGR domain protein
MTATLLYVLFAVLPSAGWYGSAEVKVFTSQETCEQVAAKLNALKTATRYRCETAVVPGNLRSTF